MGLLDFGSAFEQVGCVDRHGNRSPRGAAVASLIAATRRDLAVLSADMLGAQSHPGQFGTDCGLPTRGDRRLFRDTIESAAEGFMVIDPRPELRIVDINDAFAALTLSSRRHVPGEKLFDVFPDNPDDPEADGVGNLFASIQRAAQSGRAHTMAVQRYDVQDAAGRFVEKHWQPTNTPIFDEAGRLVFVLHHALDVTPWSLS